MIDPFLACILVLVTLALFAAPISLAMIAAAIVYLILKKHDVGLAAEQMVQGLYDSPLLLEIGRAHV